MWGYDLEYAGGTSEEHHVKIMDRPNIPAPVMFPALHGIRILLAPFGCDSL